MKPRTEVAALLRLAFQQVGQQLMGLVGPAMLGRWSDAAHSARAP